MSRRPKIALASLGGLLLLVGLACAYVLRAMDEVQPFYAAALRTDPQQLESAGRRMESRVSSLRKEATESGHWEADFTDDEVNGWLAVVLEEKYADLLPPGVSDPRVSFSRGGCKIGYRYQGRRLEAVVSVEGDAYMASPDVAAVRLQRAWFGGLPLPMSEVVTEITQSATEMEIPITWTERDDDPVLLLPLAGALSTANEHRQLERLELRDGELLLAGKTTPRAPAQASRVVHRVQSAAGR